MLSHRDSILALLSDEDSDMAALVQEQLESRGESILEDLRDLLPEVSGRTERRLREVIVQIEEQRVVRVFGELCEHFTNGNDIEDAAWALAAAVLPGEDFSEQTSRLDAWGAELRQRVRGITAPADQVRKMAEYLGEELGFRGNEEDYYESDNSLLPRVIDTRLGIPLSLALIYMAVARRAGLQVYGVGLPGHFAARLESVFFDPFHAGQTLRLADCQRLMETQGMELQPHHLLPTPPRVMLARMLNNMLHVAERENQPLAEKIHGWLASLQRAVA
jgi:regulator of sirC expression with transglutaminase-like and TPR domain